MAAGDQTWVGGVLLCPIEAHFSELRTPFDGTHTYEETRPCRKGVGDEVRGTASMHTQKGAHSRRQPPPQRWQQHQRHEQAAVYSTSVTASLPRVSRARNTVFRAKLMQRLS